jgi:Zn-dependent protease
MAASSDIQTTTGKSKEHFRASTVRVISVVVAFIILEFPSFITQFAYLLYDVIPGHLGMSRFILYALGITYIFGAINSFTNFYIYCITGKRFRQNLLKIFGWRQS